MAGVEAPRPQSRSEPELGLGHPLPCRAPPTRHRAPGPSTQGRRRSPPRGARLSPGMCQRRGPAGDGRGGRVQGEGTALPPAQNPKRRGGRPEVGGQAGLRGGRRSSHHVAQRRLRPRGSRSPPDEAQRRPCRAGGPLQRDPEQHCLTTLRVIPEPDSHADFMLLLGHLGAQRLLSRTPTSSPAQEKGTRPGRRRSRGGGGCPPRGSGGRDHTSESENCWFLKGCGVIPPDPLTGRAPRGSGRLAAQGHLPGHSKDKVQDCWPWSGRFPEATLGLDTRAAQGPGGHGQRRQSQADRKGRVSGGPATSARLTGDAQGPVRDHRGEARHSTRAEL